MKKRTKIVLAIVGAVVAIPVCFMAVYIIGSMPGSTTKLEAVGGQFKPDSSWKLVSKNVYPPRTICLDGPCGAVYYTWSTRSGFSKDKFENSLASSRYDFPVDGNCDPKDGISGSGSTICEAEGKINNASVRLNAISSVDNPGVVRIDLTVENIK